MAARLDKAIAIAAEAFIGKFDKGDKPYILHCLEVMRKVEELGEQAQIVAVLHDLIEDTEWTAEQLISVGFEERTVQLIEMVTRRKGEDYQKDYIVRCSLNPITRAVKMHDLRHNSDIMRMKGIREKDHERNAKYHEAYYYLRESARVDASKR